MSQVVYTTALLQTRPRLLLVDGDTRQLDLAAYIMKLGGYSVATATNPNTGIALAKRQRPDLLIVDYEIPVMNGCMLADRLKIILPELHTILYSGLIDIPGSEISKVSLFIPKSAALHLLLPSVAWLLRSAGESGEEGLHEDQVRKHEVATPNIARKTG
jgi:two-component system OmpR family response regulator